MIYKNDLNTADYSVLATWLNANAVPDYFASVTYSSGTITCKDADNKTVLVLTCSGELSPAEFTFYIDSTNYYYLTWASYYVSTIKEAWACSNGIMLRFVNPGNAAYENTVIITKSSSGKTACVFTTANTLAAHNTNIRALAFGDASIGADITVPKAAGNQTQFVPFVTHPAFGHVSYTPNAFYIPAGQYYDSGYAILHVGNSDYITNGCWAIKDS